MKVRELDCVKRMLEKEMYYDILNWMLESKLIKQEQIIRTDRLQERAEFLYRYLKQLEKDDTLQLVDFEWHLLPIEFIKLTCVGETEEKVFTYGL
jgi:hypothetical protein